MHNGSTYSYHAVPHMSAVLCMISLADQSVLFVGFNQRGSSMLTDLLLRSGTAVTNTRKRRLSRMYSETVKASCETRSI
jgi:hypothetical protein